MSNNDNKKHVPFEVRKKLQILYSWHELYKQTHRYGEADKAQAQIVSIKENWGIE